MIFFWNSNIKIKKFGKTKKNAYPFQQDKNYKNIIETQTNMQNKCINQHTTKHHDLFTELNLGSVEVS